MEFSSNRLKQVHSRCTTSGLVELLQNHEFCHKIRRNNVTPLEWNKHRITKHHVATIEQHYQGAKPPLS